jgi:hypothetical protein
VAGVDVEPDGSLWGGRWGGHVCVRLGGSFVILFFLGSSSLSLSVSCYQASSWLTVSICHGPCTSRVFSLFNLGDTLQ